jgi:hypothetical protein
MSPGEKVLQTPDIGALWAELYLFLAILDLDNGLFCLTEGKFKGF